MRLSVLLFALLCACGGASLPCEGPSDCSGNACCFQTPFQRGSPGVFCTETPQSCPPQTTVEYTQTRICRSDADCSAGGISTNEPTCCPSSVLSASVGTCQGKCLPR